MFGVMCCSYFAYYIELIEYLMVMMFDLLRYLLINVALVKFQIQEKS
jgi:hypothetical protein